MTTLTQDMLPESCTLLIKYCDMIWSINESNYKTILEAISNCIETDLLSIEQILQISDFIAETRPNDLRYVFKVCKKLLQKNNLQNGYSLFTRSQHLRALLVKENLITGFIPPQFIPKTQDEIFEIFQPQSFEHAILWDDLDHLQKLCLYPEFDYNISLNGTTLIDMSTKYGSVNCFRYLLMNNARITNITLENSFIGNNYEIVHICERSLPITAICMINAVHNYHNETVQYLQTKYRLDYTWSNAFYSCNLPCFFNKLFLTNDINSVDSQGNNALMVSVKAGICPVVEFLLDNNAMIDKKNGQGNTPLMLAAQNNQTKVISLLLKRGSQMEMQGSNGKTPLLHAASCEKLESVVLLLKNGANIESKDGNERTPLIYASMNGKTDIVNVLLDFGANTEARDHQMWTSLMIASHYNRVEVVKLLLERNADKEAADVQNLTSILIATENNNVDVVKLLVDKGCNIEACGFNGMTALLSANSKNYVNIMKILLEKNANIEHHDVNGRTPLIYAAMNNNVEAFKLLIEYKADINATDNDGFNSLNYATQNNCEQILEILSGLSK